MTSRYARRTPHRGFFHIAIAATVLISGCAYTLVRDGTVNQANAEQITRTLEQIRDLHFGKPVPLVVKTRDEAQQMIAADIARDFSEEQIWVGGIAGALVGLYPAGIDLRAENLKLLKDQVAGFYDPHGKQMILVDGAVGAGVFERTASFLARRDLVGEMLLAHELTHALQDQHFDLEKQLDAISGDTDRILALKAVAEGDAMLAGYDVLVGRADPSMSATLASRMGELSEEFAKQTPQTPVALSEPLIFQYSLGTKFVVRAYRGGGWGAVNALYANPPQSTQQIIAPALYYERPRLPTKITVAGYEEVLPGWAKANEDTYGQLLIQIILQRYYGNAAPELNAASRWAGDRIVMLRRGNSVGVIWLLAFVDGDAAARFAAVYASVLDRLDGGRTPHDIEYRDNLVLIAAGEPALSFEHLAPSVFTQSKVATPDSTNGRASAAPPSPRASAGPR
ncbi:MAG: hypothetical protein ACREQB_09980 [Candidatus Binataceae bacterium]